MQKGPRSRGRLIPHIVALVTCPTEKGEAEAQVAADLFQYVRSQGRPSVFDLFPGSPAMLRQFARGISGPLDLDSTDVRGLVGLMLTLPKSPTASVWPIWSAAQSAGPVLYAVIKFKSKCL